MVTFILISIVVVVVILFFISKSKENAPQMNYDIDTEFQTLKEEFLETYHQDEALHESDETTKDIYNKIKDITHNYSSHAINETLKVIISAMKSNDSEEKKEEAEKVE